MTSELNSSPVDVSFKIISTFPKAFSQGQLPKYQFPKWQLPKCQNGKYPWEVAEAWKNAFGKVPNISFNALNPSIYNFKSSVPTLRFLKLF